MKPTPGPWIITEDAADCPRGIAARIYTRETDTEDGGAVCDVHQRDEDRANARLIAAAPELADAARAALDWLERYRPMEANRKSDAARDAVHSLRAALAKVRP